MSHQTSSPAPINLLKKENKATVRLSINFASVDSETLCDGGLQFGYGPSRIWSDVTCHAVAAMHDESTFVHAVL